MCQCRNVCCNPGTATVEFLRFVISREIELAPLAIMVLFVTRHVVCKPYARRKFVQMEEA